MESVTQDYPDNMYLKFTSTPPCLKCGRLPRDLDHFRFVQTRAVARKVSDEFTVPPCRDYHRKVHRYGGEKQWWGRSHRR
jgi:hypothetical protein